MKQIDYDKQADEFEYKLKGRVCNDIWVKAARDKTLPNNGPTCYLKCIMFSLFVLQLNTLYI